MDRPAQERRRLHLPANHGLGKNRRRLTPTDYLIKKLGSLQSDVNLFSILSELLRQSRIFLIIYAILFGELKLISYLWPSVEDRLHLKNIQINLVFCSICTIFALRKNIGGLFSVYRRLLGSKRALYLVNTSEEFLYAYGCQGVIVISITVLNANSFQRVFLLA